MLKSMPVRTRAIISVMLVGAVVLYALSVYVHLHQKLADLHENSVQKLHQKNIFEQTLVRFNVVTEQHQRLVDEYNTLCLPLGSLQETTNLLLQTLEEHHISCRGIEQVRSVKKDCFQKHYVKIEGKGSFRDFMNFLGCVTSFKNPVSCTWLVLDKRRTQRLIKFQAMMRIICLSKGLIHETM